MKNALKKRWMILTLIGVLTVAHAIPGTALASESETAPTEVAAVTPAGETAVSPAVQEQAPAAEEGAQTEGQPAEETIAPVQSGEEIQSGEGTQSGEEAKPGEEAQPADETQSDENVPPAEDPASEEETQSQDPAPTGEDPASEPAQETEPAENGELPAEETDPVQTPEEEEAPAGELTETPAEETPAEEEQPEEEAEPEEETEPEEEETVDPTENLLLTIRVGEGVQVVRVPATIEDFRFWTVAARPAFARADISVLEEKNTSAREVGTLAADGIAYVLEDVDDGWLYVESGNVRGFVRTENMIIGEEAGEIYGKLSEEAASAHPGLSDEELAEWLNAPLATETVPYLENSALTYLRATTRPTVVDEIYALPAGGKVNIYESPDSSSRAVGQLMQNGFCYVLEGISRVEDDSEVVARNDKVNRIITDAIEEFSDQTRWSGLNSLKTILAQKSREVAAAEGLPGDAELSEAFAAETKYRIIGFDEWLYVESGNVRGFVQSSELRFDDALQEQIAESGTEDYTRATILVRSEENRALYYTLTSVKSGVPGGTVQESIVDYAAQYIGNPYVWGGTDLVHGADCSGFVQTIYRQYGYELPRIAEDQAMVGTMIDLDKAEAGDLIFYRNAEGHIYHVAIYAGNGETIEAHSTARGIIRGTVNSRACWAVRVIKEQNANEIPETYEGYPVGTNNCYTVTHHYGTRNWKYSCRTVWQKWREAGSVYTDNVATINGYYLIACTSLFGKVGDAITWYFDDGSKIETIMADTKSAGDPHYTPWGHISGSTINVLEFETDKLINPGNPGCLPQIAGKRVVSWANHGAVTWGTAQR